MPDLIIAVRQLLQPARHVTTAPQLVSRFRKPANRPGDRPRQIKAQTNRYDQHKQKKL